MNIIITVNSSWNITNYRMGLIKKLISLGHNITVVANDEGRIEQIINSGCEFISLPMTRRGHSITEGFKILKFIYQLLLRRRPDLVLSYTIKNNIYFGIVCRILGFRFFPNISGIGVAFNRGFAFKRLVTTLYQIALRNCPKVVFQNEDDSVLFKNLGIVSNNQIVLVPGSGVDTEKFMPQYKREGGAFNFLFIGRLIAEKGLVEFSKAAEIIKARYGEVRFSVAGPLLSKQEGGIDPEFIEAWKESGLFEFLGFCEDIRPAIAGADCVVLPSYREGRPKCLLEAAAMAVPVITSDAPGCRDAVIDGVTGFVCSVKNVSSLVDAMEKMLKLTISERYQMKRSARQTAEEKYSENIVIQTYCQIIDA